MCDLKKVAAQDSRNIKKFANAVGFDWLEDEADQNIEDPSRAMRKAAIAAATWYAGGALGGAAGSGAGAAGSAAGNAAGAAAGAFPASLSTMPISEIAQLATQNPSLYEGMLQTMQAAPEVSGGLLGGEAAQGMMAPVVEKSFNANQVPVTDLSRQAGLLDKGRFLMGGKMGDTQKMMMMNMGSSLMSPQQPQMMPQSPPPRGGEMQPMPAPYQQETYGPGNNALGLLGAESLTEEQKRKLRMMGVKI